MVEYDEIYPEFGFAKHKGYGTAEHYDALHRYGPTPIHRRSFRLNRKKHLTSGCSLVRCFFVLIVINETFGVIKGFYNICTEVLLPD